MDRLAVGADGSTASRAALRWTAALAAGTGAEVVAVDAWSAGSDETEHATFDRPLDRWLVGSGTDSVPGSCGPRSERPPSAARHLGANVIEQLGQRDDLLPCLARAGWAHRDRRAVLGGDADPTITSRSDMATLREDRTTITTGAERSSSSRHLAAEATGLMKRYGTGNTEVVALAGIDVGFEAGKLTAIMGSSGSGKSTLLHCVAGLDELTEGEVRIGDTLISELSDRALTLLRRERLGFIFQAFNLVPTLTAEENIRLPLLLGGHKPDREWEQRVVESLGLDDRLHHHPDELSGGQQQRVAVARALVTRPEIIFADEPTGNLDSSAGAEVLSFLRRAVDDFDQTVVMVTHDPGAASYADTVVFLRDGRLVDSIQDPTTELVFDRIRALEA